jgi:hypothetical protein
MEPAAFFAQYKVLRMFLNDHLLDHVDRNRFSNDRRKCPILGFHAKVKCRMQCRVPVELVCEFYRNFQGFLASLS